VILEDDGPSCPIADFRATTTSADVGSSSADGDAGLRRTFPTCDPASELSKVTDPSDPERWYDLEADCFVDEEPQN
jgi:hypothetical protein